MISVIVPVFNVEAYIEECLNSILAQTYSSFELILVDDGSKDRSGEICEEYKEKDPRIRVFHKENGGLSSARNTGLDEARGEFICFIDSDDAIRSDYLEKLYDKITSDDSDMAVCDINAQKLTKADMHFKNVKTMTANDARKWLYDMRSREYVLMVVAWNKLYKKSLFDGIRYPEGIIHEDEFVIEPLLEKCSKISFVQEKLYVYRDNETGITSDANRMDVRHLDGIDALGKRIEYALKNNDKNYARITLKNALYKCAGLFGDASSFNAPDMKKKTVKKYKSLYLEFKDLLLPRQRLKYRLFWVCPRLFCRIYIL